MLLSSMQKGFFKFVFLGLLVMAAIGLMFSDWNGVFRGGGVTKTDVASVDGHQIKIAEFHTKVSRVLRSQNLDATKAYQLGIIDQILQRDILDMVMHSTTKELGVQIEDKIIAEQIRDIVSGFKGKGMSDKDALARFLQMQGMSEKQLIAALRSETANNIIEETISTTAYQPSALLNDIAAYREETRTVDIAFFPNDSVTLTTEPSAEQLKSYYAGISSFYMEPEKRDVTIALFDQASLTKPVIVTDADVKTFYAENADKFTMAEQKFVEQAIVDSKEKADSILAMIKGGKPMKDAAREISKSDSAYYPETPLTKDGLMAEIGDPVFVAKDDAILDPIKTPLGWHVIHVIRGEAAHTQPLDKVADKIRTDLQDEKNGDALYDATTAIEDRLATGETFEEITKDYKAQIIAIKNLTTKSDPSKDFGFAGKNAGSVLTKIFASMETEPSSLSDAGDGKLYTLRVDKIIPATAKPYESVATDIRARWIDENKADQNLAALQKKADALNAGTIKFSGLSGKIERGITVSRSTADKSSLPQDVTLRLIEADTDKVILALSREKNGIYLAKITKVVLGDKPADEKFRDEAEKQAGNSNLDMFIQSVQSKHEININRDLLTRTYGRDKNSTDE